jgi:hypothetical protein
LGEFSRGYWLLAVGDWHRERGYFRKVVEDIPESLLPNLWTALSDGVRPSKLYES